MTIILISPVIAVTLIDLITTVSATEIAINGLAEVATKPATVEKTGSVSINAAFLASLRLKLGD